MSFSNKELLFFGKKKLKIISGQLTININLTQAWTGSISFKNVTTSETLFTIAKSTNNLNTSKIITLNQFDKLSFTPSSKYVSSDERTYYWGFNSNKSNSNVSFSSENYARYIFFHISILNFPASVYVTDSNY